MGYEAGRQEIAGSFQYCFTDSSVSILTNLQSIAAHLSCSVLFDRVICCIDKVMIWSTAVSAVEPLTLLSRTRVASCRCLLPGDCL